MSAHSLVFFGVESAHRLGQGQRLLLAVGVAEPRDVAVRILAVEDHDEVDPDAVDRGRDVAGDPVVVLESMKMEIPVVAPQDGTLASISVSEGTPVEVGDLIATMN